MFYELLSDDMPTTRATDTNKADIVLFISGEHPLMQQLQSLFGEECFMRDFVTIEISDKYVTLRHIGTGRLVSYTSEDRLLWHNKRIVL